MQKLLILLILVTVMSIGAQAFAQDPIISKNVVVLQNLTSAAQCPSSYRGTGQQADITAETAGGMYNGTSGAVVQSCSGCVFNQVAGTCTCRICYGYYN